MFSVLKAKPHVDFGVRGSRIRYMVEKIIKTFFFSRLGYHFQGFIGGFSGQVLVSWFSRFFFLFHMLLLAWAMVASLKCWIILPACIFCVLLKNVEGNSSPLFKVVTWLMFLCQCFCVHISCFFFLASLRERKRSKVRNIFLFAIFFQLVLCDNYTEVDIIQVV